ncbi:Bacterial type II/III secretion system short domain protein [Gemmata obscuriglobus]|uniref:NolW-like domain-containing protein n=1 Tax=Gemmata obscuriglobus TaxID=114 RepID=A0A2Z3H357_9BACT|nr:secretin N-terminal domain-containing protein [Gemmata obscuriglobus]AWM40443.1 hypothetical protein C1280_27965 [Gemmata obscuriglobus]QEG26317.1 Bacterial type II/III secretion system short domain protein [Gemmata obscuriglobus]VTS01240.1 : Secretin_N [Gemmata obscuriglobus UQM 2246]
MIAAVALLSLVGGIDPGPKTWPLQADVAKPVVVPLIRADAERVAARLRARFGVKVVADKASNTVFVWANAGHVERVRALLAGLDTPQYNYIVCLQSADPITTARVARAVSAVLAFLRDEPEVFLVPLERNRTIFFTATDAQATCVSWLVRQLDRR